MINKENNLFLSIIIVNYNAGILLAQCVNSVSNSIENVEIIIVDNASKDNSIALLEKEIIKSNDVVVYFNEKNMGFSAACNKGIQLAKGRVLFFLNPDCVLEKETIHLLINNLESRPEIGMCGAMLLNEDGTEQIGGRRLVPTPWRTLVRIFKLSSLAKRYPRLFIDFNLHKQPLPEEPIEVEAISGACMMVKRQLVEEVGLWDEGYFLHCEDLDWCMRFRQKGWKIQFVPDAKVVHFKGVCSRSRPVFVEWHKHKGMMRFYRKFFQHQYPGMLMWLVSLGVWLRFSMIAIVITSQRAIELFRGKSE